MATRTIKLGVTGGVLVFLGFLIFIPLLLATLNYAGVCLLQNRKLSDEELIFLAVNHVNNLPVLNYQSDGVGKVIKQIPYQNVQKFVEDNPDCCEISVGKRRGDESAPPGILSRAFGLYRGDVRISYVAKYIDEEGQQKSMSLPGMVTLTNCGARSD